MEHGSQSGSLQNSQVFILWLYNGMMFPSDGIHRKQAMLRSHSELRVLRSPLFPHHLELLPVLGLEGDLEPVYLLVAETGALHSLGPMGPLHSHLSPPILRPTKNAKAAGALFLNNRFRSFQFWQFWQWLLIGTPTDSRGRVCGSMPRRVPQQIYRVSTRGICRARSSYAHMPRSSSALLLVPVACIPFPTDPRIRS